MTQFFNQCTLLQNPPLCGKNELAVAALMKSNNTPTVSRSPTPAAAVAPPIVFALFSVTQYLEANLQQIFKAGLGFRPSSLFSAPIPPSEQYVSPCKRLLKARIPDVYWDKTHLKYFHFFQQYEDYFATARAKGQNWMPFATTFLKNTVLFCW